jgi:hypothetical protein
LKSGPPALFGEVSGKGTQEKVYPLEAFLKRGKKIKKGVN